MDLALRFQLDDLTGAAIRRLVAQHRTRMHAISPRDSVHALDVDALRQPDVTCWSAWAGADLAGCGALKQLDAARGELKSMRVADAFLGRGVGKAILAHLIAAARARGLTSLWLETGTGPAFAPAHRLYEGAGFVRCGPFTGYVADPFSVFMTRAI
ncbi:MAG: GNAT family N-acetyltransferase [Myxococcales bacterium]|nr:GNAT family N-acetyltransferase [Myxococcales bacterium]